MPSVAPRILRWLVSGLRGGEAERSISRAFEELGAGLEDEDGFGAEVVEGGGGDSSSEECTNSDDRGTLLGLLPDADLGWPGRVEARRSMRTEGVGFLS